MKFIDKFSGANDRLVDVIVQVGNCTFDQGRQIVDHYLNEGMIRYDIDVVAEKVSVIIRIDDITYETIRTLILEKGF